MTSLCAPPSLWCAFTLEWDWWLVQVLVQVLVQMQLEHPIWARLQVEHIQAHSPHLHPRRTSQCRTSSAPC